ncbi:MAG: hypothetical protein ACK5PF_10500 [bacterium]
MFTEILSDTAGQAALSRFATANTWAAAQTFTLSATFSAGLTSTGLAQFTSSSTTVGGVVSRANGTISANPAGYANCAFQSVGAQAATATNMFDACAGVSNIVLRRRNGTYSAQTTTANNDAIAQIDGSGFDSVTFRTNAQIQMFAVETFTSTANGTAMAFATTPAGTTTLTTRLTLHTTANFTVPVISGGNYVRVTTAQSPATSAAAGATGDIAWDDTYLYVRQSTGWRRIALGAAF